MSEALKGKREREKVNISNYNKESKKNLNKYSNT